MARGIGRAGATIVLNDIIGDRLDKAMESLKSEGIKAFGSIFNVTRKDEIAKAVEDIETNIGPIGILFNNTGIQRRTTLEDFPGIQLGRYHGSTLRACFSPPSRSIRE